jgi:hypothetical protein
MPKLSCSVRVVLNRNERLVVHGYKPKLNRTDNGRAESGVGESLDLEKLQTNLPQAGLSLSQLRTMIDAKQSLTFKQMEVATHEVCLSILFAWITSTQCYQKTHMQ